MKSNDYRKTYRIDRFARKWYCQHARLNQLRNDKKCAKKAARRQNKKELEYEICSFYSGV